MCLLLLLCGLPTEHHVHTGVVWFGAGEPLNSNLLSTQGALFLLVLNGILDTVVLTILPVASYTSKSISFLLVFAILYRQSSVVLNG